MSDVLLVDDDADHRQLFGHFLSVAGHRVRSAASADAALALTAAHRFDAAVLDLRLPGADGVDLCRQLRMRPATADLPSLVFSAEVNAARIHAALSAGADDFLSKPARRADFTAAVQALRARRISTALRPAHAAALATRAATPAVAGWVRGERVPE